MTPEEIRSFEKDHTPDGWPAIRMRDISALLDEIDRLNKALKYEQHRAERIGTHADGCWAWGPAHYECAVREIERLKLRAGNGYALKIESLIAERDALSAKLKEPQEQMTPQDITYWANEAGLYDDDQEPLVEHLAKFAQLARINCHDHYKRILWDVCKNYGTAGECVFAGFKAALDKEAKCQ